MKRFLIVILLTLVCSSIVFAQGTTGGLSGTVSGPDGALPGATVVATDNATRRETTTTTNESGAFQFPQLEFGTYTIRVTASGFKTLVANEQKIDVGRDASLSLTLEIGEVTAEVVITAGADIVTATTAQVSNTVSPQQILALPLITRSPLTLTSLQAGVSANSAQNTTINGMRTTFTNITRDGINIQDTFIRSNATDFAPGRPSVDDTAEFTITTTNQEADQGYGGAQIRLVTPRGTSDFHGALFAYNRNSAFAANSFFNNQSRNEDGTPADVALKPSYRNRNQYGGKASWRLPVPGLGEGTPMLFWDKAFWFFAYEKIKDPVSDPATRTILSPEARAGTFQYARGAAGDPINTTLNGANITCPAWAGGTAPRPTCSITNFLQFAQGIFPQGNIRSTISPFIQSNIIDRLPTASNFTGGDGLNTQGFRLLRASDQERDQYSTRIDVDINDRNSINFVYNFNEEINLRPDIDTTGFTPIPDGIQSSANKQFTAAYRRVFTPNFINELRFGIFTSEVPFDRLSPYPDFIPAVPLVSGVSIISGANTFTDQGRNTKGFNYQSNADWILGKHTLRFGGQLQFFKVNAFNDAGTVPTVTFASGTGTTFSSTDLPGGIDSTQLAIANGLLGLLGGHYTQVAQSFNVTTLEEGFTRGATEFRPFRFENHALYIADRWQAMRGLSLNFGLRYEVFPALRNLTGRGLEPLITDLDDPVASLLNPGGSYVQLGTSIGKPNAYYNTQWNNFAPNVGVAWSPTFENGFLGGIFGNGRSVIRAGYSHVFGNDSIVTSINNASIGNAGLARTTRTLAITPPTSGRIDTNPVPTVDEPSLPVIPFSYLVNNGPGIGNHFGTVFGIDPNIEVPRVKQYSFGWQREIGWDTAFEIRYVGTQSNNLARGVDFGQIDVVNNGFLTDFLRAQNNLRLSIAANPNSPASQTAFCFGVTPGCTQLQIFQNGGAPSSGHVVVGGAAGVNATAFRNNLTNGTPLDLALSIINSLNPRNVNNQPCIGQLGAFVCNPNATPHINFLPNNSTGVVDFFANEGSYRYDSLQTEIRKRFANGLYFQANYTFSKNLTDTIGTSQALFEPFLDNNQRELDRQRADFDTTHVFNLNGIYQLPFGQGKRFLNYGGGWDKLFGGWEISGLMNWQSGAPISFVDTRGTLNRAGRSARQGVNTNLTSEEIRALMGFYEINGTYFWIDPSVLNIQTNSAGEVISSRASNGYSLNGTTFANQVFFNTNPGETGNLGRTIVNGPKFLNVNAGLLKNIRFTESMRLQLRMEAFNLLNNVNFDISAAQQLANINSPTFGQLTFISGPREVQFAARFEW